MYNICILKNIILKFLKFVFLAISIEEDDDLKIINIINNNNKFNNNNNAQTRVNLYYTIYIVLNFFHYI